MSKNQTRFIADIYLEGRNALRLRKSEGVLRTFVGTHKSGITLEDHRVATVKWLKKFYAKSANLPLFAHVFNKPAKVTVVFDENMTIGNIILNDTDEKPKDMLLIAVKADRTMPNYGHIRWEYFQELRIEGKRNLLALLRFKN